MSLKERIKQKKAAKALSTPVVVDEKFVSKYQTLKDELNDYIVENMNYSKFSDKYNEVDRAVYIKDLIDKKLDKDYLNLFISKDDKEKLIIELINENKYLGPLTQLYEDALVSAIYVNAPNEVYVEKNSQLHKTSISFKDNSQVYKVMEKIFLQAGQRISPENKTATAKLINGSTISAIFPPVSSENIYLVIKKFNKAICSFDSLTNREFLTYELANFLEFAITQNINFVISGTPATGKTTLMSAMCHKLPTTERIVFIKNAEEIEFTHPHCLTINEAIGTNTINKVLLLNPNKIIYPDISMGDLYSLLNTTNQSANSILTNINTAYPEQVLAGIKQNIFNENKYLPEKIVNDITKKLVHLVIHLGKTSEGIMKLMSISQPSIVKDELTLEKIVEYKETLNKEGILQGKYKSCGIYPEFINMDKFEAFGLDSRFFEKDYEHERFDDVIEVEDDNEIHVEKSDFEHTFTKPKKLSIKSRLKRES